jgi:hypothetical protein
MTNSATLSEVQLRQFTGSENWYRHGINRAVLFTDGAKFLADQGGAYWLLDIIAIAQQHDARVSGEEFQVWNLKVHSDRSATVFCDDGNGNPVYTQEIPFTDFPLDEVKLYFANNVIHLLRRGGLFKWPGGPHSSLRTVSPPVHFNAVNSKVVPSSQSIRGPRSTEYSPK